MDAKLLGIPEPDVELAKTSGKITGALVIPPNVLNPTIVINPATGEREVVSASNARDLERHLKWTIVGPAEKPKAAVAPEVAPKVEENTNEGNTSLNLSTTHDDETVKNALANLDNLRAQAMALGHAVDSSMGIAALQALINPEPEEVEDVVDVETVTETEKGLSEPVVEEESPNSPIDNGKTTLVMPEIRLNEARKGRGKAKG
jgi:hypothetical protein